MTDSDTDHWDDEPYTPIMRVRDFVETAGWRVATGGADAPYEDEEEDAPAPVS